MLWRHHNDTFSWVDAVYLRDSCILLLFSRTVRLRKIQMVTQIKCGIKAKRHEPRGELIAQYRPPMSFRYSISRMICTVYPVWYVQYISYDMYSISRMISIRLCFALFYYRSEFMWFTYPYALIWIHLHWGNHAGAGSATLTDRSKIDPFQLLTYYKNETVIIMLWIHYNNVLSYTIVALAKYLCDQRFHEAFIH